MIKILIYQKETSYAELLRMEIKKYFLQLKCNFELATYTNCDVIIKKLTVNPYEYDIVLLDYDDFSKTKEIIELIRRENMLCSLLLIGNMRNAPDSIQILRYRPSGLFDKSIEFHLLRQSLAFEYSLHCQRNQFFCINNKEKIIRFPFPQIEFFMSCQKYVSITTTNNNVYHFLSKLDDVENKISNQVFIRCHKSFIVNIWNVLELDKINHRFRMMSGHTVEISRSHYKDVQEAYRNYSDLHIYSNFP
ncbi:MAG TPA: LytTR family DNA-binding domain-containing protein [Ruminiclostridium sp.]|nr:LytTR family DNA-binding domain-containing protein [Ruminiclostridium sp.]